jgi:hypothetical protein
MPDSQIALGGWDVNGESEFFLITVDNSTVAILPDGTIGVVGSSYTKVDLRSDEPHKGYEFGEELEQLRKACAHLGLELTADFRGVGEEERDIWRTLIQANIYVLQHEFPKLVWSNGDEEQLG